MVEYGMGYRLTAKQHELIKDVMEPIEEALMLTNDYWSWDREYEDWKTNGNRLWRFFRCSGLKFLLHDRYKVMQCWSQFAQDGFCHDAAIHRKLQHRIFAHEILDNYRSVENPVR